MQKHDARRLHYDLRLEWDGVLLSWAVTRGPSDDPAERRLAVRTEDHPVSYADFEGTIPAGAYGGGTVMLWDRGTWTPLEDVAEGLRRGRLRFEVTGQRMRGAWLLVRMRNQGKRENWLLIKSRDAHAGDRADDLVARFDDSVATGRNLAEIAADGQSGPVPTSAPAAALPAFHRPQLATLVERPPDGDHWLHETKFDGYRCIAAVAGGHARLYTRSGKDWTGRFAALAGAFAALDCDSALLDGEVVARDGAGGSSFSTLQRALGSGGPLRFVAFDLLARDGRDLRDEPLIARKQALADLLPSRAEAGLLHASEYVRGHGAEVLARICAAGGEGIVSKRVDAPYRGRRSRTWLKSKCTRRQEFVVGGYSPSDKQGREFASLLLGQFDAGRLRYAGRVGSGFSHDDQERLSRLMARRRRRTSPFDTVPANVATKAHWVAPELVVEVDFTEFTADGHVRHAVFRGRREDKMAQQVEPDRPTAAERDAQPVAGVRITHGEREVFPSAGFTKADLARYFAKVADRMIATSARRPLSLVRCPQGLKKACFYQKHAGKGFPAALREIEVEERSGERAPYLYFTGRAGLVAAAQMGTIELHTWGARIDRLERPDRLVFDLDPHPSVSFAETRRAACELRDHLRRLGLASTPLLTGGKGIHVVIPLRRSHSWETVKTFAKTFAHVMARREPARYTAHMAKRKREGRIFIDWLRNERGATAIAPYSVRARTGAPVAVPVTWRELASVEHAGAYSIADIDKRLKKPCPYARAWRDLQTLDRDTVDALDDFTRT